MPGILGTGTQFQREALSGMERASELDQKRIAANKQMREAKTGQVIGAAASGAGIGFAVGGPLGAGIGAAAGFLLGEIF